MLSITYGLSVGPGRGFYPPDVEGGGDVLHLLSAFDGLVRIRDLTFHRARKGLGKGKSDVEDESLSLKSRVLTPSR